MKTVRYLIPVLLSLVLAACGPEDEPSNTSESEPAAAEDSQSQTGKLDINSATAEELSELPGIGEVMAQRIIDARPFSSIDELPKVKGLGEKTLQQIRDLIEVSPAD